MKRVVCIKDDFLHTYPHPIKGEIYTVEGQSDDPDFSDFILLTEFNYVGNHRGYRVAFNPSWFRPTDDTFGEVVAEIISDKIKKEDLQTIEV